MLSAVTSLWIIAALSALVMSIGLAIIRLASESEPESLIMLPLELHPRIPPNPVSRVFFHLMTVAFVALYGSLLILLFLTRWYDVVIWGVVLFFFHAHGMVTGVVAATHHRN
jgi:hypothetical protein